MNAWLVVGLGNPGERYADTRHNVGARVVERLAERLGTRFRKARFLQAEVAEARADGEQLYLFRPRSYMNESGPPIASFAKRHGIDPGHVVAVHDEIDLEFGKLKVKQGGSTAGHNGLRSMVGSLGDESFHRVRLGVGRPPGRKDAADHVLQAFPKRQREGVELLIEEAADAILTLVSDGLATAQDRFNRPRTQD